MPPAGLTAVTLVAVVAVAGCSTGGLGPASASPTPTPDWPPTMPPGVTTTHVDDPLALARAHTSTLVGRSFTYRETVSVHTADGIPLGTVTTERRVDADGRFVHRMRTEGVVPSAVTSLGAVDAYSDGSETIIRYRAAGRNRTLVSDVGAASISAYDVVQKGTLYQLLVATDPRVAGPVARDNTASLHLQGENGRVTLGVTRATDVSFEALVAPSGLVHRFAVRYRAVDPSYGSWEGRVGRTVTYEAVGSTAVERPGWVASASQRATAVGPGR